MEREMLSTTELTNLSKAEQKAADELIEEGKVKTTLQNFGEVVFTGSYGLGLMLDSRDIDIYVMNEEVGQKENAQRALNRFISQGFFNGYHYYDWFHFRKDIFPKGYYVGLQIPKEDKKWKFDIWFFDKRPKEFLDLMDKISKLPEEKKGLILQMKYLKNINQSKIGAFDIYNLVLEGRVKTVEDFTPQLHG